MKALARFVGPVPGHDQSIELHNLLLETEQLSAERGETCAGNLRHPPVAWVGNNMQKFRNPFAPDRRDNAKLGKCARIALITAVCWRMNRWRVRWSIRQLCCSGVLVGTNRILALVTASQMASASVASFFCRLT